MAALTCAAFTPVRADEPAIESKKTTREKSSAATVTAAQPVVVAAKVAGQPIFAAEVAGELATLLKNRKVDPQARAQLEAEMLALLVNRRLVVAYLAGASQGAEPQLVDARVKEIGDMVKGRGGTLAEHLKSSGLDERALRADIAWRLGWSRYVERHVTDAVLERYFNTHRRDFDGTEIRASQVLFSLPKQTDAAELKKALDTAADVRRQIVEGKLPFGEAVKQFSTAPSKTANGDLGWLMRHGTMPEAISAAVFQLKQGELSPPVVSPFGVHLLLATEIRPGKKTWRDAAAELRSAVIQQGFERITKNQRDKTAVEFTGATPYFDPKTGKLVMPAGQGSVETGSTAK